MYRLLCACGKESEIRGSQAGSQLTCECGRVNSIPPLSVLNADRQRNEPSKVSSASSPATTQDAAASFKPSTEFLWGCGQVGPKGSVSSSSMKSYVHQLGTRLQAFLLERKDISFSETMGSIALAPGGDQRIEFDVYPKDSPFSERDQLLSILRSVTAPPIHHAPIAFAFLLRGKYLTEPERSFVMFPSLADPIKSIGMEETLRCHFAGQDFSVPKKSHREGQTAWWQRLLVSLKLRKPTAPPPLVQSPAMRFAADQRWLEECEAMAGHFSMLELKQLIASHPEDYRFQVAYAEMLSQQEQWENAIQWYDRLVETIGPAPIFLGRRALLHYRAGSSEAALRDLSAAIDAAPFHPNFLLDRSEIYGELEAWEAARLDLEAALELSSIDPEPLGRRAMLNLRQRKLDEVAADLREVIRLDPNDGEAHFYLGWICAEHFENQWAEAIEYLTRAIDLAPQALNARLRRSLVYLAQNKHALALADCDYVLELVPDHAEALGIRGRILQGDAQHQEAIAACSRSIELGFEHPLVYLARAIAYACTDETSKAVEDCDSALALDPNNIWAIQFRGQLLLQSGDLDAAMELFNRARELAPDWTEPREHLALVHRMKENPQLAVDEQTALIEQHPEQASHYVNRAFAYTQMQAYGEAAADYDRAIELEPENERLYFVRGVFRMQCQERQLALDDFDRVLSITGGDDQARAYRATLLLQLHRYQEAIDEFAQLISKYPDHPHAYSGRAIAFAAFGNTERAEADTERLNEMAPEVVDEVRQHTKAATVYRHLRSEEYDAALDCAEQLVAEYPEQSLGYRLRAHVRWEREEYVEAADDYTRVLELDEPKPEYFSSRGQVLAELGEWEQALADLDRAVTTAREQGQKMVLAYALNGRALTLSGLDRDEESTRDFNESVSLCPTNPWVYYHRGIRKYQLEEVEEARRNLKLALEHSDPPLSKRKKLRAQAILEKLA